MVWAALGTLALLLLLFVALVPRLVAVERYRGRLELALEKATGWEVELGEIDLSLLRGLALTVSPARMSAPDGGSRLEIPVLAIRAELMPLLRGQLNVNQISLQEPKGEIVRRTVEEGWVLPGPRLGGDHASAEQPARGQGFKVAITAIEIHDGALRLSDRSAQPPVTLALEQVETTLHPSSGELSGSAELEGGGGKLDWNGRLQDAVTLELSDVRTEAVQPWLGQELLRPGGLLQGTLELKLPDRVSGSIKANELRLLAGERPLEETVLDLALVSRDEGWFAERLELKSGAARLTGEGFLTPALNMTLKLPPTALEPALALARAFFPMSLELEPPGSVEAVIQARTTGEGAVSYQAQGQLSAAGFKLGGGLPDARNLRCAFELSPQGKLTARLLGGELAGGPLEGTLHVPRLSPLKEMVFDGRVRQASMGLLLAGLVEKAPERVSGPADVQARIGIDLSRESFDLTALKGSLELNASQVRLPGWDLEQSVRVKLQEKLGGLGDLVSRSGKLPDQESGAKQAAERLIESLNLDVGLDGKPWSLRRLALEAGGVSAVGSGSYDPISGAVQAVFAATCSPELTAELVGRYSNLERLVNASGRLALPLRIGGTLMSPAVSVDLGKLLQDRLASEDPKEKAKEAAKDKLRDWLDRRLDKKKKEEQKLPEDAP